MLHPPAAMIDVAVGGSLYEYMQGWPHCVGDCSSPEPVYIDPGMGDNSGRAQPAARRGPRFAQRRRF